MRAAALVLVLAALVSNSSSRADTREECEARIARATQTGLVGAVWDDVEGVHVEIRGDVWSDLPFPHKVGIARTFECARGGTGERAPLIVFHDHRSRKRLAYFERGRLIVED